MFQQRLDLSYLSFPIEKEMNKFLFFWNNFQKLIRESEEELRKICCFMGNKIS